MIRVRQVVVDVNHISDEIIKLSLAKKLKIEENEIISFRINKESLDARFKPNLNYIFEIDVSLR